ncbi:MAG: FHA domain-containing protein [Bacteroidota bacterium]
MMSRIYKIGSDERNDIVLDHSSISEFHAEIYLDPQQNCYYTDLNSSGGSKVNGKNISAPIFLNAGDILILGERQVLDWEGIFFNRKKVAVEQKSGPNARMKKELASTPKISILEDGFVSKNKDLLLIFGAILFFLILLNFIM